MWLLIIAYAAVISTALWYSKAGNDAYGFKYLALILWGTAIMAFIDHLHSYLTEGGEFLEASLDNVLLGLSALLIALIMWIVIVLIKDPRRVVH